MADDGETTDQPAGAPSPPSHVDTVRQIQEALGRGDIMAPMAHLSRKVRWAVACADRDAAPFFKEYTGRQGVVAFMEAMDVVDMTAFDIRAVFGEGDHVAVWLHMAFTTPTGRTVDMEETQIWTFSEGKVISVDLFPDTKAVAEAFA
ncbi:MAG TPA: nuclear transport factor 2 family protein [Acidimicrobiales bacterium]|nr:nuclear transport factor 2 family protein [Acidimicrobiales bacterium]